MNFVSRFPKLEVDSCYCQGLLYIHTVTRAGMIMYTSGYKSLNIFLSTAGDVAQNAVGRVSTGLISEVRVYQKTALLTQPSVNAALQQLGQQSRWQLWLTPQQKLSRNGFSLVGLLLTKVMQINQLSL